jgi:hypothetical protein
MLTTAAHLGSVQLAAMRRTNCDLYQCARCLFATKKLGMWKPASSAPFDRDLELAVIDRDGPHALVFPCRRVLRGWMNAMTRQLIDVHPTHWREWPQRF